VTEAAGVALGANLGRPGAAFREALGHLAGTPGVRLAAVSRAWRSAPWGCTDQPPFLNAAALLETSLAPDELLDVLRAEERMAGRRRGRRWGPRTLDLDLLFHGRAVVDGPRLTLPHPHLAERTFVLRPLAEVAPDWRHPVTGATPEAMLDALRRSGRATDCRLAAGVRLADPAGSPACPA
jgi:2-amino-4-hydroxy-6-hydroxymethyldihydropteridine diphosphokinase